MQNHIIPSEISWLSFNSCILDEAGDHNNPLYERIKFMAIHSSNLDEFFRVKVNRLLNEYPEINAPLLNKVLSEVNSQQNWFGKIWRDSIIPELADNGIVLYENQEIDKGHLAEIEYYFKSIILSYIQVIYISKHSPKSYFLDNRSLYLFVKLQDVNGNFNYAYLNIPSEKLDRYRQLQSRQHTYYIISIDTIIKKCLSFIFPLETVISCNAIKLNRDENYKIIDEASGNLIAKIQAKVKERRLGSTTRFLYDLNMDAETLSVCKSAFQLHENEMVQGGSHHNFFDLFKFPNPLKPMLQNDNYAPLRHIAFENNTSIFETIDNRSQLLCFPYQSYHYVLQFFNQAAIHKNVTEIKITLYRISSQSLIANALISAARNGKKVTVFVEVKARFDEANNLFWSNEMKKAGVKIIYSIPNLKVHAKVALITMKTEKGKKFYSYLATGNFNESTANTYSDFGFFTAESDFTSDLKKLFSFLKTKEKPALLDNLLVAGFNMKDELIKMIDIEISNKVMGKEASIFMKINGLDDKQIINKLIEASQQGVDVTLIVRGICILVPGINGITDNIKIYRIVDMFLEHARIYRFANGGKQKLFLSSADMLNRNLDRRIEVAFPIKSKQHADEINTIIRLQLEDNTKKRTINALGMNFMPIRDSNNLRRAQIEIYKYIESKNQAEEY